MTSNGRPEREYGFASVDIIGKLAKMVNPDPSAPLAVVNQ
jgi:hypothetical protein